MFFYLFHGASLLPLHWKPSRGCTSSRGARTAAEPPIAIPGTGSIAVARMTDSQYNKENQGCYSCSLRPKPWCIATKTSNLRGTKQCGRSEIRWTGEGGVTAGLPDSSPETKMQHLTVAITTVAELGPLKKHVSLTLLCTPSTGTRR